MTASRSALALIGALAVTALAGCGSSSHDLQVRYVSTATLKRTISCDAATAGMVAHVPAFCGTHPQLRLPAGFGLIVGPAVVNKQTVYSPDDLLRHDNGCDQTISLVVSVERGYMPHLLEEIGRSESRLKKIFSVSNTSLPTVANGNWRLLQILDVEAGQVVLTAYGPLKNYPGLFGKVDLAAFNGVPLTHTNPATTSSCGPAKLKAQNPGMLAAAKYVISHLSFH